MDIPRLIAPLVTPFTDDASTVSEVRLARLMRWYRESGAEGLMIGSEAGEYASLSLAERKRVLDWVSRDSGELALYVNVTAQTTAIAIDVCQHGADCGAVGAVLSPPPVGSLGLEEARNFLTVVRRHGGLSVGFLDPSGGLSEVCAGVETVGAKPSEALAAHDLGHFAVTEHGGATECWTPSGIVHPVAVFGQAKGAAMLSQWSVFRPVIEGLLRHSGLARIGKYVAEANGIEVGPLRGPFMPLNQAGREAVDHIMKSV